MPRKIRPICVCGDVAYITLTQGHEAIIDAADVPLVQVKNWYAAVKSNTVYARGEGGNATKRHRVFIHNVIMGNSKGLFVDHIDGDGLNNRRCNMRLATRAQNMRNQKKNSRNTSGLKGVSFDKRREKWYAKIKLNRIEKFLGYFASPEEAHAVYFAASRELHGEFGRTE